MEKNQQRLYAVVQIDFNDMDRKVRKVIALRNDLLQAMRELQGGLEDYPLLALKEELNHQEESKILLDKMITAMASDYRCVYYVDLDLDEATCVRTDSTDSTVHAEGETFKFLERFTWYANNCVAENYREGFINFIQNKNIKKALIVLFQKFK